MKKAFTLFCAVTFSFALSFSQDLIAFPNDSDFISANVAEEFDLVESHLYIVNNTASATTYTWGMLDYSAPVPPWELKLCDNNNCYDLLLGSNRHESLVVAAGDTMEMKFQFSPHCIDGVGSVNVVVYATNDSANASVVLNYKADLTTSCATAIKNVAATALRIFPNPVKSSFTVAGLESAGDLSFEVYDLKGAAVTSKVSNATATSIEISIEGLPVGVYVLKAFDTNGKVMGTARLNKID
ncbi:MAG TPA: T9SS type A sorting domain-containing protein [Chitinophagales bacterium]|nr:T9SS type A sorting domain-containing protein [Chitinophagales bacterium]